MYEFLKNAQSPKVIAEAVKLIGTKEIVGKQHNQTILDWAEDLGLKTIYTNDEIPWCGLFVAHVVKQAGFEVVNKPLWALSWSNWGQAVTTPMFGDVLTFKRNGGGHVGFYVGEDETCYHVLGGNQSNAVNVIRIEKKRLHKARRCQWKVAQPEAVKVVKLSAKGTISKNEV
ncbi:MAG: TIGR02594 family protein [Flavobacteriales bacterium]|nr:TIGR02594 family protein [Flavobacteriales bacterium]